MDNEKSYQCMIHVNLMTKGHLAYKCRRTCSVNFEHGAELNANIFVKTVLYFYIVLPSNKNVMFPG